MGLLLQWVPYFSGSPLRGVLLFGGDGSPIRGNTVTYLNYSIHVFVSEQHVFKPHKNLL